MIKKFIFEQANVTLTNKMQSQFDYYCAFLLEENQKYNLTAITDSNEVWEKHFADSILGCVFAPSNASLCDIGSGAGFPSIPLKIVRNDLSVTLVDSLQKRIAFTQALCEKLGVEASFFHARAEDFAKTHSEVFDVATARAVAPLPVLLEYTAQIVKPGGTVLAYKTDLSEVESAQNACGKLGLKLQGYKQFVLPGGGNRCLLAYRKIAHTPKIYPRGQNKPRKYPL